MRWFVLFFAIISSVLCVRTFTVANSDITITSAHRVDFTLVIDTTRSNPTLEVTPFGLTDDGMVSYSAGNLTISLASSTSGSNNFGPTISTVLILSFWAYFHNKKALCLFLGVFGCFFVATAFNPQVDYFTVKLTIPSANFLINSLAIDLPGASAVQLNNGQIQDLGIVNVGGTITLLNSVVGHAYLQAGTVTVSGVSFVQGTGDITIDSPNPTITFVSFVGNASYPSGTSVTVIGTQCTDNPTTSTITCGNATQILTVVTTQTNLTIDFGGIIDKNYRDPVPSDNPAISPALSTIIPAESFTIPLSKWVYSEQWGTTSGSATVQGSEVVVVPNNTNWRPNYFWLLCHECLPSVSTDTYDFTLQFREVIDTAGFNVHNLTAFVLKSKYQNYEDYDPVLAYSDPKSLVLARSTIDPPFGATYKSLSFTLTPSEPMYSGYFQWDARKTWETSRYSNINTKYAVLAILVELEKSGVSNKTFYLKDTVMTRRQRSVVAPSSVLTNFNSDIMVYKTPTLLGPQTQSNCPWDETGLKLWNDPDTWGSTGLPTPASDVVLPANTKVLVTSKAFTSSSDVWNLIHIPATSELIFSDYPFNISVRNIIVEGKFRMGSDTCRLWSKVTVTFVGDKVMNDVPLQGYGNKGIVVFGSIDIHGKYYEPTWTRLRASAKAGDVQLYLQASVNWEVGQRVGIATSIHTDVWFDQHELRTITAVDNTGAYSIIELDKPLTYHHYGGQEYQSEVTLIDRRIVFQGDSASDLESYGGHIIVVGSGYGRFSGLQTYRMGQQNVMGRYPIHFHLIGISSNSLVSDVSCFSNYYRCVTIHATHEITLTKTTTYNVSGHSFYLEDGVEENNTITYNAVMKINPIGGPMLGGSGQGGAVIDESVNLLNPTDSAPSGFYISNAHNTIVGNAASGGFTGFSLPNFFSPLGNSRSLNFNPSGRPTLIFDGNTAHSAGATWNEGSCMYTGGNLSYIWGTNTLRYNSGRYSRNTIDVYNNSAPVWMRFFNVKTWLCNKGIHHWGNRLEIVNYESYDNDRSCTMFGEAWLDNAVISFGSGNPFTAQEGNTKNGFQFYDISVKSVLTRVQFRGFQPVNTTNPDPTYDNYAIVALWHSDKFKPQGINAVSDISFVDTPPSQYIGHYVRDTGASRQFNMVDWTGSAIGQSTRHIVGSNIDWWNFDPTCFKQYGLWRCPQDTAKYEVATASLIIPGVVVSSNPEPPQGTSIGYGYVYLWGDGTAGVRAINFTTQPGVTGVTSKGWFFSPTTIPGTFEIELNLIPYGHFVMFAMEFPSGTTFTIYSQLRWSSTKYATFASVASFSALTASTDGTSYYFDGTYLYIKLIDKYIKQTDYFERGGVRVYDVDYGYYLSVSASCGGSCGSGSTTPPSLTF